VIVQPLIPLSDFIGLDRCTWLYSGAESPPLQGARQAVDDYMAARAFGPDGRARNTEIESECRKRVAALLHGEPEQIAFTSNASEAISNIALSLDLKPGDNIVINNLEFPSGVLPWLALKAHDIEVRLVTHRDWVIIAEDVMELVDERTRLVTISHVSYLSGSRLDYQQLYRELQESGTLLLLDATQSLGAVEVDVSAADFVVASTYKWMLAIHGAAVLAVNPKRTANIQSRLLGWRGIADMFSPSRYQSFTQHSDARRFELGYPSYATLYALHHSVGRLLDIGIERIEQHIMELGDLLIAELQQAGYNLMTPVERERRGGNIAIVCPEGERVSDALRQDHIYTWGGDNRLRASVHLFNTPGDIETYIDALRCHFPV
jgi:selenocysteine lyase/cysteine desulfurase